MLRGKRFRGRRVLNRRGVCRGATMAEWEILSVTLHVGGRLKYGCWISLMKFKCYVNFPSRSGVRGLG